MKIKPILWALTGCVGAITLLASCNNQPAKTAATPPTTAPPASVPVSTKAADADLLGATPSVDFYFPPYATSQPQWQGEQLKLDLAPARNKEMAVLSLKLPTNLKPNAEYTLRFLARSSATAPLIVTLPQAKSGAVAGEGGKVARADSWAQHDADGQLNGAAKLREVSFRYTPAKVMDGDKIQFFWDKAALAKPVQFTFSQVSLLPATAPAPIKAPAIVKAPAKGQGAAPFPAEFWYPPYAATQPQWQDGAITVNLDEPKGQNKKMAALTLKLPANLKKDGDYRISFEALSSAGGPMIVQVPEPDAKGEKEGAKFKARGDWQMQFPGAAKKRSLVFVNRPQLTVGGEQITLFWGEDALKAGGTWTLRDFKFAAVGE